MTTLRDTIADALIPYIGDVDQRWLDKVTNAILDAVVIYQGDESFELRARRDAPPTSKIAVDRIKAGTAQEEVFRAFTTNNSGWTDDELEQYTGRSHQSVSSIRNILMNKGYVRDSGDTRLTLSDNPAIVYVYTGKEITR